MKTTSKSILSVKELTHKGLKYHFVQIYRNDFNDDEWNEYIEYEKKMYFDTHNKESDTTKEIYIQMLTDKVSDYDQNRFLLLDQEGTIAARSFIWYFKKSSDMYKDFELEADMFLDVHPNHRQKGLGSLVMNELLMFAQSINKEKLQSSFSSDAAKAFTQKFEFKIASERFLSELKVEDIDHNKMKQWASGPKKIEIYQVIPEKMVEEYCKLYTACGLMAPDYEGDFTATEQLTPHGLRMREQEFIEKGIILFSAISVEEDGTLSGMTELDYGDGYFKQVDQGLTGVLPTYRGQGVGKQLKAALLLHVLNKNPKAEVIHTANNVKNYAMLAINEEMGFKKTKPHYLVTKTL